MGTTGQRDTTGPMQEVVEADVIRQQLWPQYRTPTRIARASVYRNLPPPSGP